MLQEQVASILSCLIKFCLLHSHEICDVDKTELLGLACSKRSVCPEWTKNYKCLPWMFSKQIVPVSKHATNARSGYGPGEGAS